MRFGRKDTSRKRIDTPFVSAMNLTTASDHKRFYVGIIESLVKGIVKIAYKKAILEASEPKKGKHT